MSVELEPTELGFRRPLTREVSEALHIYNPHDRPIIFKVKTTAPRRYCVRPNSGRIEPGKSMEVQVLLQGMKEEPPLDTRCKDKFLVLSVVVTADKDFSNIASIWQEVERMAKSTIQERKIRVNYLPAESSEQVKKEEGSPNGIPQYDDEPPAYTSPAAAKFETPANNRTVMHDTSPPHPQDHETSKEPDNSATQETPKAAPADTSPPQPAGEKSKFTEDLIAQLAETKGQLQKLKSQQADNELRQRKAGGGSKTSGLQQQQTASAQSAETGVPVRVVALLCLLSFLLAYIFF